MNATIAEFPLHRVSDSAELARRARLFATLVHLPVRRRRELEEAVEEVCQVIATHGGSASVRFALNQRNGQRFVEVSVRDAHAGTSDQAKSADQTASQRRSDEDGDTSLRRLGESLDHFDVSSWPRAGAVIHMGQALAPHFDSPTESEAARWGEMLRSRSFEDALVLSLQYGRAVAVKLGRAQDREALQEQFGGVGASENMAMLSLVASKSRNLISFMDSEGKITWVNESFVLSTGYSPTEAIGRRLDELLFGPSSEEVAVREFAQALANGHDWKGDILFYRKDGQTFWTECDLMPIRDSDGNIVRWLSIDVDISKRRQTEDSLKTAKQLAESNGRAKSEFLANMSHEIRTPMNAIIGMTELAMTTELTREQWDYLRTVRVSAETLLQLLNDILDLSKIEAGKLEIEEIDFNLADVVRDTLRALAVKAHEKGLELAAHVPMDLPQFVRGDPIRIKQILFNLVGNAIKFTERGEVVVDIESQWMTDDEIGLHFAVRDTGIGIPKEKLNQIFEAFTQADSATTRHYGGTGLGLTITSELVRLMQGKIWVESNVDRGSTFHFTVQMRRSKETPEPIDHADAESLRGKTVLVVDDNATNRRILDEMLRHWGLVPTLADGANAAIIELETAANQGRPFDLVLLDAMMPGTDGFQLAEMIKNNPEYQCGTVMMLSSADRPNSASKCEQLGIDDYLVKPISISTLLESILSKINGPSPSSESFVRSSRSNEIEASAPPSRKLRILVVDDHEANRKLATTVLGKRGHNCREATDGVEALKVLGQEGFDAVLMDVQMPTMDGFQATRALREREKATGKHMPVIAMTAHAMAGDREKCLSAGMDAYLSKPLRPRDLVALVESLDKANVDSEVESVTKKSTNDQVVAQAEEYDFDAALESMDNELDLLVQQMEYLVHDGPELLQQLTDAITKKDARGVELAAHRLKGLVSRYGAQAANDLALQLEIMGRDDRLDEANEVLEHLTPLVHHLVEAINTYVSEHPSDT